MKDSLTNYNKEFEEMVGNLSEAVHQTSDPVAIATMLYSIAEEKKSSNLVIRDINAKFDVIIEKLNTLLSTVKEFNDSRNIPIKTSAETLSEKDKQVLDFVKEREEVCADEVQKEFGYRGRNAASARLSRLFKDNLLEKVYAGRKVYYKSKD